MPDVMAFAEPVRVTPAPRLIRLLLRGDPAALGASLGVTLPTTPCTAQPGKRAALWLGPDEWLLLTAEPMPAPPWENESGAVFDISDRQIGFIIEGERVMDILAAHCPLDLAAFAIGACTRTVFAKAEIVLWRREAASFHLETGRSFAPYVQQLLTHAISTLPAGAPANVAI